MVNSQQSRRLFTVVSAYRRALIEDRPTTQPTPLGRIVIEREAAIIEAADQHGPARSHVAEVPDLRDSLRRVSLAQAAIAAAIGFDRS